MLFLKAFFPVNNESSVFQVPQFVISAFLKTTELHLCAFQVMHEFFVVILSVDFKTNF